MTPCFLDLGRPPDLVHQKAALGQRRGARRAEGHQDDHLGHPRRPLGLLRRSLVVGGLRNHHAGFLRRSIRMLMPVATSSFNLLLQHLHFRQWRVLFRLKRGDFLYHSDAVVL